MGKEKFLIGLDYDGTLADVHLNHSVSRNFFDILAECKNQYELYWGICTGRSLEYILEGMELASFPFDPDYLVTQERDVYYLLDGSYHADEERNSLATNELNQLLQDNDKIIQQCKSYVESETKGEWISVEGDPAGIIATSEDEIQAVVDLFHSLATCFSDLDYQRNTIYLRFSHKGYCKGTAVQYLQKKWGISPDNTLVMGDNYNDLTMLNSSVARYYGGPKNSISTLKERLAESGGFISSQSCADGVAEALSRILLDGKSMTS